MNTDLVPDYLKVLEDRNVLAWIELHKIKNERGMAITFDNHPFMIEPYLDWTPLQGVRKSSQCGWSVMTNIKLMYAAKHGIRDKDGNVIVDAANVIYTLPSDNDVSAFVPSKTNLLIKNNEIIQDYLLDEEGNRPDADSIQRKKLGNSMIYFRGTQSKTAAIMLTSDLNIHDESDRSNQFVIDEYESRVGASTYQGRWIFSNPSAPNMPADLLYQQSDQKHWCIKCDRCGHWQYLEWAKVSDSPVTQGNHSFVDDTGEIAQYICCRCQGVITDDNRKHGRWINKSNADISGYWVSQLIYPWVSAQKLLTTEKNKSTDYFMNFVLGMPYVGSDVVVDGQTIVNNIVLSGDWQPTVGRCVLGVDNGDVKHWVLGDETGIWHCGKTRDWEDIEHLIRTYQPFTVIDQNPYPNRPRELAKKYRHVWLSYYIEESKTYSLVDWGEGDKAHMVYPVRNLLFDDLIAHMAAGGIKFYKAKSYWEEYIAHWETMYRADMVGTKLAQQVGTPAPGQVMRGVWLSSTGTDHFCHATLYYYVALSRLKHGQGQLLRGTTTPTSIVAEAQGAPVPVAPVVERMPEHVVVHGPKKPLVMTPKKKVSMNASISSKRA